jgi:hypothetical protein
VRIAVHIAGLAVLLTMIAGCKGSPDQIRMGMSYEEVENILGKPAAVRRGITFVDSSRVARVIRRSEVPVVNFAPGDNRVNWMYEISTKDTAVMAVRSGATGKIENIPYICTLNYCVLFDPDKGRVVFYGYYPASITRYR